MKYIGLLIVVVVIGVGAYILLGGNSEEPSTLEQGTDAIDQAEALKDTIEDRNNQIVSDLEGGSVDQGIGGAPARVYSIGSQSSVSYTVQKEFFSKPTEPVTGTTQDVSGTLTYGVGTNMLDVNAMVNPQTLDSGSGARDKYVREQFRGNITIVVEDYFIENRSEGTTVSVPVQLTMNGITRSVNFNVGAAVSEQRIEASGSATINMTDFNVTPASLANVYIVDEIAIISFDLTAE